MPADLVWALVALVICCMLTVVLVGWLCHMSDQAGYWRGYEYGRQQLSDRLTRQPQPQAGEEPK